VGVETLLAKEVGSEPAALTDLTYQDNLPPARQALPLPGEAPDRHMKRAVDMSGRVLLGFADVDEQRVTE
jgi:hypothetical protein